MGKREKSGEKMTPAERRKLNRKARKPKPYTPPGEEKRWQLSELQELGGYCLDCEEGFLVYRLGSSGTCEIFDIWIHPRRQRRGQGRKLVEEMILATPLVQTYYVYTRKENKKARLFYVNLGFTKVAELEDFYFDGPAIMFTRQVKKDERKKYIEQQDSNRTPSLSE